MREVKSVDSSAAGPVRLQAFSNLSVVEYSTSIRAGRSVRLHTTARPSVTSPAATPCGMAGRDSCDLRMAGAYPSGAPAPSTPRPACTNRRRVTRPDADIARRLLDPGRDRPE